MRTPVGHRIARPVRVLHVVSHFGSAGTEIGISKIANLADRSRVTTSICSTRWVPHNRPALEDDVSLHELHGSLGNDPNIVVRLYRLLRRQRPDIVHTHGWGTLCEGLVAAKLARVPAVVHGEHGTMELRRRNLYVQRWAWQRTSQLLSVSSKLADRMATTVGVPRDAIKVIRNGVDAQRFSVLDRTAARRALGLSCDDLVVGTVGRFTAVKDHANALHASRSLLDRGHPHVLVLAGDGPLRGSLEQEARDLGIAGHVRFLGFRADVEHVMAALDIFALPSKSEGLSNTTLEAMASGVPVVATHVGGTEELVDHGRTGLLVEPRNPDALGAALAELATDRDRRQRMGRLGRQRAHTEFSLSTMVRGYEQLYVSLLNPDAGRTDT